MGFETAVWRALAVFRGLGLLYAYAVYARRFDEYLHPVGGWVVLGVMTVWTVVVSILYSRPAGRRWPVLWLDLAIAVAAVVLPRWLDDPSRIAAGAQTLPVVWAAAPVLAFAIRGSWPAGLGAAGVLAAADLVHRGSLTVPTANNIVLLALSGAVVGYAVDLGRRGEGALGRALAVSAAAAERERLSRDIHDGVLQVLALVGRRGRELGGEAAELGRLAAEQEQSLRALVGASAQEVAGAIDVRALLTSYASPVVTVSTPATPVVLAAARARELAAAVGAALANVAAHAGASTSCGPHSPASNAASLKAPPGAGATPANASARSRCRHPRRCTTARPVRCNASARSESGSSSPRIRAGSPPATITDDTVSPARS